MLNWNSHAYSFHLKEAELDSCSIDSGRLLAFFDLYHSNGDLLLALFCFINILIVLTKLHLLLQPILVVFHKYFAMQHIFVIFCYGTDNRNKK